MKILYFTKMHSFHTTVYIPATYTQLYSGTYILVYFFNMQAWHILCKLLSVHYSCGLSQNRWMCY